MYETFPEVWNLERFHAAMVSWFKVAWPYVFGT